MRLNPIWKKYLVSRCFLDFPIFVFCLVIIVLDHDQNVDQCVNLNGFSYYYPSTKYSSYSSLIMAFNVTVLISMVFPQDSATINAGHSPAWKQMRFFTGNLNLRCICIPSVYHCISAGQLVGHTFRLLCNFTALLLLAQNLSGGEKNQRSDKYFWKVCPRSIWGGGTLGEL